MSWQEQAACRGKPIELFFPTESGGRGGADYGAAARQICRTCPVIGDCWREHHDERHGIFFGTNPRMRGIRDSRSPISLRGGVWKKTGLSTSGARHDLGRL